MLVLIHTVPPLIGVFDSLCREILPGAAVKHILDEPLLEMVRRRGALDPADAERLLGHVQAAEAVGARAVLVTCSTTSPLVDEIRPRVGIPVLKVDEAMITAAVRAGPRLGVIATNRTTLEPTQLLLRRQGAQDGRELQVKLVFVDRALEALLAGDGATHDRLVAAAVHSLAPRVDAVVLAQASTARALVVMPDLPCPVFSSPQYALREIVQKGLLAR
jgi:Asp/Glu/hydantoin racemase